MMAAESISRRLTDSMQLWQMADGAAGDKQFAYRPESCGTDRGGLRSNYLCEITKQQDGASRLSG